MIKQIITVHRKKFATGLFWQPLGLGNRAQSYAKQLSKNNNKKYTLFIEYKSMVGLTNSNDGAHSGMPSAAVEVVNALSEFVSFLGVFSVENGFYLVAVRNGIIIRDALIDNADYARKIYAQLSEIPDWGALFAPSEWGMPKSQEKSLSDLIRKTTGVKLRQISVVKSIIPSVVFAALFVAFGIYILSHPISETSNKKTPLNSELAAQYRKQIELKKQEIINRKLQVEDNTFKYPYDNLPNVMERADLCYRAIAFVMQPIPGWNQTYTKCDEEYVSATFARDFGTLNDFYEIGARLMPGAIVQQISENEIIVRVKLPKLPTYTSLDERDQITVARDIATEFQKINTVADIESVSDFVSNGNQVENVNIVEVAASSKMIPSEFMQIFNGFDGVYMTSVIWKTNTRTWSYEVIVYTK